MTSHVTFKMQRKRDSYLLQNATKVYYKMSQVFPMFFSVQNKAVLLENATVTKYDVYHKKILVQSIVVHIKK